MAQLVERVLLGALAGHQVRGDTDGRPTTDRLSWSLPGPPRGGGGFEAGVKLDAGSAEKHAIDSEDTGSAPNDTRLRKPPGSILYLFAQLLKPLD